MAYRFFRINCFVRIIALSATILLLVYLLRETTLYATSLVAAIAVVLQVASMIHYVEKTNRDLARFLTSIKYSDFSQSFAGRQRGSSFESLNAAFDEVIAEFHKARSEKEEQYRYLQTVIQHIGLGLLAYDASGSVDLINNAAKKLLRVTHLNNVKSLESFSRRLVETLLKLKPGEKALVKIEDEAEELHLAVYATAVRIRNKSITLVSMQNIESELAEQEMLAWQKLIRVLTHEIMNSVTPIASLASTVNNMIGAEGESATGLSIESAEDVRQAVATIEKRSRGLLHFTEAYRNLTRIPKPNFSVFPAIDLLERVTQLMEGQVRKNNVKPTIEVEPRSLELTADRELVEQVLINLILNAIHALKDTPDKKVELKSRLDDRGRVLVTVADNGPGIDESVKEKIFTPFFTTKKDGSGIGLSLSREIMRLHKGRISVQSAPGEHTVFTLRF
ncbi:MAG: GHKL domain-containing protein [Candidatus Zixiibacteriota bacterium]|nr:MAG: GHKL domain-containing protein [candidate division Zixibacteria bacterium]